MTLTIKAGLKQELQELRHLTHRRFLSTETTGLITKWIEDGLKTAARNGLSAQTFSIRDIYNQLGFTGEALTVGEIDYIRKYLSNWLKEQDIALDNDPAKNSDILKISWHHES